MLFGEEPKVRSIPVHAIVMPAPEAIVRTPRQRRRYNKMWRGTDRRQDVRLAQLLPEQHRG